MRKTVQLLAILLSVSASAFGQEYSFNDLVNMRANTYPAFETNVHNHGYKLNHLEYDEKCAVFSNGTSSISYCHYYDDELSYHNHVAIKFETADKDLYERMKQQVEASAKYYKTKMHVFRRLHYLEHIYANDDVSVHLYDITYKDDDKPYYEIEVYSIFAAY